LETNTEFNDSSSSKNSYVQKILKVKKLQQILERLVFLAHRFFVSTGNEGVGR